MKKYIIIAIGLLFTSGLFAQGIYNNGARIAVGTGAYLTIGGTSGSYRNESNGTNGSIDLNGKIILNGNFTNNVSAADVIAVAGTGSEVQFNGTASQTIGGTTTVPVAFPNLTINNSTGIVAGTNMQVNGTLALTTGLVDIGNNNFTFGSAALIAGTPSASNMIISSGTGKVQKLWSATGSFTYPIGEKTLTASYLPVSLSFTAGTFAAGAVTAVNMVNTKYNDPTIIGSYLNRYWNVSQTGVSAFTSNVVFQYLPTDVNGTETSVSTLRVLPTPFATFNAANTVQHQLSATGLTAFGTFTGGLSTDKTLNLSAVMLEGLYAGAGTMRQAQDALGAHWPAGVADHITVELHDATTYATIVFTAVDVPLSTTGTATITVPAIYGGSYYITIKHRNSLETTTATAISFSNNIINQSFAAPANVFGGNLGLSTDNHYMIYGGDVNQDGLIDFNDYVAVDNNSYNYAVGYLPSDVDGNGIIDFNDYIHIDNNNFNYVNSLHP